MSKRLRELFAQSHASRRALFGPYVTGGYPTPETTVPLLLAMEAGGADLIEIGMPFTDPLADGATIQHANQIAVEQGVTVKDCFAFVREARALGLKAPVLLMGYYNPILSLGEETCALLAHEAGVDGFIVVDLPPEEATGFLAACRANDLSFVPLVAPTTTTERVAKLAAVADAFLYVVSVTGTTGNNNINLGSLPAFLGRIHGVTELPLGIGFGISSREDVEAVGKIADAAFVGAAIIRAIDAASPDQVIERVREYVEDVTGR